MHFIPEKMKCLIRWMLFSFVILPGVVFAEWEMAGSPSAVPSDPFFQAGNQQNTAFPPAGGDAMASQYANLGTPAPVYAISISGSLKQNLERIFGRYHWRVIWKAPFDYNFDGRITGASVPDVLEKLLKPFPLQAVMYMSNRTMVIVPRQKLNE